MSKVIDQFPQVAGGPLVIVPCDPHGFNARRSARADITARPIPVMTEDKAFPNLNWFPAAAIRFEGPAIGRVGANGGEIVGNDAVERVAFWLTGYSLSSAGTTPIDVDWQIRAVSECTPEVPPDGTGKIHISDIGQVGMIVQAAGYECNGYELWMRVNSATPNAEVVLLSIQVRASRIGSLARAVVKGSVSI